MGFFQNRKKGLCPECGEEIEDINVEFCSNCGWKISQFKAIKARRDKLTESKMKKHEENAEKHKQEFKQSIKELKDSKEEFKQIKEDFKKSTSENKEHVRKKYCANCGMELVDFAKFCPNCGKRVNNNSSSVEHISNNSSILSRKEITRQTIKSMGADGVSGIDKNELTEKFLYFYDNNIPVSERINILMETFNISYEDAKWLEYVQFTKISLITDYFINKDEGATTFDIEGKNGMLKTDLSIDEYVSHIGFMINNNAVPLFKKSGNEDDALNFKQNQLVRGDKDKSSTSKQNQLVSYSIVNYVDLYETRAVRHSTGASYGKKGFRVYSGSSSSAQEWRKLGRGNLTLEGDRCYFVGGGQQRIIDRKKIINIVYYSNKAGIEISVSNRQKTMKYLLPGRTIEDGKRLANAIKHGMSSVSLTELSKDPSSFGEKLSKFFGS